MGDGSVALEISARSFVRTRGVDMMYKKVVRIAVAVVSEPAMLSQRLDRTLVGSGLQE
jgi:hypothetical protein